MGPHATRARAAPRRDQGGAHKGGTVPGDTLEEMRANGPRSRGKLESSPRARASTCSATSGGRVLYIGKAKSLRPRVRSYFQAAVHARGRPSRSSTERRRHRGDRHRQRGRGAPPRAEPRQASPAAVQRPPARRQVVPVHRRDHGGRLPAGHVHARAAPARRRLLRPVREREEGARDARRPQPRLPATGRARGRSRAATRASRASTTTSSAAWRRAWPTSPRRTTGR